jgi:oligosaccharide repeat unit polymerase
MSLAAVAFLALVPILLYWRMHRTIFNPVSLLFSSFSATIGFAYLVDYLASTWELHGGFRTNPDAVASLYAAGLGAFLLPWLPYPRRKTHGTSVPSVPVKDMGHLKSWTYACSGLVLLSLAACALALGSIPIVAMLLKQYTIAEHIENIKRLPVGLMALVLLSTFLLILHLASMLAHRRVYRVRPFDLAWFGLVLLLSSVWQGNRQCFLIIIFFVTARWSLAVAARVRRSLSADVIRIVVGAGIIVMFVAFFTLVGAVRHSATGERPRLELLTYFSWPVYNVMAIHDSGHFGGSTVPHYVLTEILPSRFGGKAKVVEMGQYLFEPTSPSGYFSYWFLDYGYPGVIAGALALSVFCRWAYGRRKRGEVEMRIYLLALWCCATAGIYNHFLSLHYFWFPLAILFAERWFIHGRWYQPPPALPMNDRRVLPPELAQVQF